MHMHVVQRGPFTQLQWLFLVVGRALEEVVADLDAQAPLSPVTRNKIAMLSLAIDTAELASLDFEDAVVGVIGAIGRQRLAEPELVDALMQPLYDELGPYYVRGVAGRV